MALVKFQVSRHQFAHFAQFFCLYDEFCGAFVGILAAYRKPYRLKEGLSEEGA
jgi:hypothetical protein